MGDAIALSLEASGIEQAQATASPDPSAAPDASATRMPAARMRPLPGRVGIARRRPAPVVATVVLSDGPTRRARWSRSRPPSARRPRRADLHDRARHRGRRRAGAEPVRHDRVAAGPTDPETLAGRRDDRRALLRSTDRRRSRRSTRASARRSATSRRSGDAAVRRRGPAARARRRAFAAHWFNRFP